MIDVEELRSGGVLPSGPVSAWPHSRNVELRKQAVAKIVAEKRQDSNSEKSEGVTATFSDMTKGLLRTAGQALRNGKVSKEIREERYDTCKNCPLFLEDSKRCSDCGCFMEAKTWVAGNPDTLCPKKKWSR